MLHESQMTGVDLLKIFFLSQVVRVVPLWHIVAVNWISQFDPDFLGDFHHPPVNGGLSALPYPSCCDFVVMRHWKKLKHWNIGDATSKSILTPA